jgi:hypothetical protein
MKMILRLRVEGCAKLNVAPYQAALHTRRDTPAQQVSTNHFDPHRFAAVPERGITTDIACNNLAIGSPDVEFTANLIDAQGANPPTEAFSAHNCNTDSANNPFKPDMPTHAANRQGCTFW